MGQLDVIRHETINGVRLFFNTLDYRTQHFHKEIEIMWALEGKMTIQFGAEAVSVSEGQMILINSHQPHEIKSTDRSCTLLGVHLSPDIIAMEVPAIANIEFEEQLISSLPEERYKKIEKRMLEVVWQYLTKPDYYELFCRNQMQFLLYELLTELPNRVLAEEKILEQRQQNERLNRFIQFVDDNYMNPVRLSDFAAQEGRSLSHISHFVQSTMNQSFREYVDLVRFNAACKMIATEHRKMIDVCMACGFSDYRYFSKAFVKRTGKTPEAYGRLLREKVGDETSFKHSIHSREKFYTPEQSIHLVEKYRRKYGVKA